MTIQVTKFDGFFAPDLVKITNVKRHLVRLGIVYIKRNRAGGRGFQRAQVTCTVRDRTGEQRKWRTAPNGERPVGRTAELPAGEAVVVHGT